MSARLGQADLNFPRKDLDSRQLQAALASLGHVYSTEEFLKIYDDLVRKHGAVTYEAFVEFLVNYDPALRRTSANFLHDEGDYHGRLLFSRAINRSVPLAGSRRRRCD
jgi:hypothetical protein